MKKIVSLAVLAIVVSFNSKAQNQQQTGAWYMYFYNASFDSCRFGVQGDIQYRNWDLGGDLEQLLIRSGLTYKPKNSDVLLTLGYGNITSGAFGDSKAISGRESRIYQEALYKVKFSERFITNHRFRFEQRFVEGQDLRTRYRYNIFVTVPLSKPMLEDKTLYLSLYNELFINGQRDIGNNKRVEIFDRNRFYSALGYKFSSKSKVQVGVMRQVTDSWGKNQLQVSLHNTF